MLNRVRPMSYSLEVSSRDRSIHRPGVSFVYALEARIEYRYRTVFSVDSWDEGGATSDWSGEVDDDYTDPHHDYSLWAAPDFPAAMIERFWDEHLRAEPLSLTVAVAGLRDEVSTSAARFLKMVKERGTLPPNERFLARLADHCGARVKP